MRPSRPMPRATSCTSAPTRLAQVRHLVDEGDLDRQEGVGGIFRQLRGLDAGEHDRRLDQVERAIELPQHVAGALAFRADHHPVGAHEIADGVALAQELRIGRNVEVEVGARGADDLRDLATCADRDRGFGDDDGVAGERPGHLLGSGEDVGQIGVAVAASGRCADRDEHRLRVVQRGGEIRGEREPAGGDILRHQLFEAGLVDRHAALLQGGELLRVHFHDRDVGAELGEARSLEA